MTRDETIVFLHAHPDDEAIFTGGTIRLLADAGQHVTVVIATSGELGAALGEQSLADARRAETEAACSLLGVSELVFLGYPDSGMDGEAEDGLVTRPHAAVTERLCAALADRSLAPSSMVSYDERGIYGHPDHVHVAAVARNAATELGLETTYAASVDREYLHFVETHVVVEAEFGSRPVDLGLAATELGLPTALIDTTVDVRPVLDTKRSAMAAHASQLPHDAAMFSLGTQNFAATYGYEWYLRSGPPGAIEALTTVV